MATITRRSAGWMGILFVVLLFLNAGMVSLPSSGETEDFIASFYASNRTIILIAQSIGLLAAPVFVAFAIGLQNNISQKSRSGKLNAIGWAGIIVALVSVGTAIPVIALSVTTAGLPFWIKMTDWSDVALFLAITGFCLAGNTLGREGPIWWRVLAALTGLLALARSVAGFAGVVSVLDGIAPMAFVLLVLASGIYLLVRTGRGGESASP